MNPAWYYNPAFWNNIPRGERNRLMYSWLAYRQRFTHAHIKKLLTPGFDSKAEQERQNQLAQIFGLKWGESPFLSNSPATKNILRSRFKYQRKKWRKEQSNKNALLLASSDANESVAVVNAERNVSSYLQDHNFTTPAKQTNQSGRDKDIDQLVMSVESIYIARRVSNSPYNATISIAAEEDEIETILTPAPAITTNNQMSVSKLNKVVVIMNANGETMSPMSIHLDLTNEAHHNANQALPPVRRRVIFFDEEDTPPIAQSEATNIRNRNSNHYSSDLSLRNRPSQKTVKRHVKKFMTSILEEGGNEGDVTKKMSSLKIALDLFSNNSSEAIKNEKGTDWMQCYFVPELRALIPRTEEEKEKVLYESCGSSALNLLDMMIQSSGNNSKGRKGDSLQHSIDIVLAAILSPEKETLPAGITCMEMLGKTHVHYTTYTRARKKRAVLNRFLEDTKKMDYDYDLCCKEFDQKMEEMGSTTWKGQIRSVDMKVNAMLKIIQEIYGMTTLLTEHLSLQYLAFQRTRWSSFNLTSIANGHEAVLRRIKLENGSLHDLTVNDFELSIVRKTNVEKMENPFAAGVFDTKVKELTILTT